MSVGVTLKRRGQRRMTESPPLPVTVVHVKNMMGAKRDGSNKKSYNTKELGTRLLKGDD